VRAAPAVTYREDVPVR